MNKINYQDFIASISATNPREEWSEDLQSLWYAAKGDWEASHNIAQDIPTEFGSLIHACLHRVEGDVFNASYWYKQANRSIPTCSFKEELKLLIQEAVTN